MFGDISRGVVPISQQVHDIQIHQFVRDFSHPWARNLRFVSVPGTLDQASSTALAKEKDAGPTEEDADTDSDVSNISRPSMISIQSRSECCCRQKPYFPIEGLSELQITTKDPPEIADCIHYVAISYCWKSQEEENPKYSVQGVKGQRPNRAPSVILARAVAFAAHHNLGLVWIDQECIDQEDREDQEQGIQSMDLVYQQASYAVALLTVRITSQAHVDALSKIVQGEELTPSELLDAVEALEIIAADRWLERAWCFQEAAAAGESLRLLIPCDLGFTGDEDFYSIPGEIEMTVYEIHAGASWVTVCADEIDPALEMAAGMASDLKVRAERVFNTFMGMCPIAYQTEPRNPEFRFGCNASEALQLLGDRQNGRFEDRLAILANVCNYATRLNTHKLRESEKSMGREHSFSLCFLVLALLNGDMSLVFCSRLQVQRQLQLEGYQNSNKTPQIPAWMLLGDTKLRDLPCTEESYGLQFRLPRPSFDFGSLVILGHFWVVDRSVNLRKVQQRFASPLKDEVISESPAPWEYELLWSILRELWRSDMHVLANKLWHRVRLDEILPVPAVLSTVIDCTTGDLDVPFSRLMELGEDKYQSLPQRLLKGGGPRHLPWMGRRAIEKGSLWCGRRVVESREHWNRSRAPSEVLSVFDCDGPVTILTPHSEQLETWERFLHVVANPLTWIAKKTGRASEAGEVLKCHELVRGVWSSDAKTAQRYVLE